MFVSLHGLCYANWLPVSFPLSATMRCKLEMLSTVPSGRYAKKVKSNQYLTRLAFLVMYSLGGEIPLGQKKS